MWAFMILAVLVLLGLIFCVIFISVRTAGFPLILGIAKGKRPIAILISFAIYLGACAVMYLTMNAVNAVICIVHLGGFWLLSELIFKIARKASGRSIPGYIPGVCAIIFTVCYMTAAWFLCNHVWEKDYDFETSKLKGDLRIIQFADSHVGSTFDAAGLEEYVKRINELHPDIVAVCGDFVDDDTTRDDMIGSCEALGKLETKYGVYFSYGNHDKGYYSADKRGWNSDDLRENLIKNDVIVLEDEVKLIDNRFYVIGRKDRSEDQRSSGRMTPEQLMADLDPDLYKIVLDHQPCDYDQEAEAGAGLVMSGHSHGGQFFPFNNIGVLTRQYDRAYGHERRGETDFVVTSGISDWTLLFKTGCRSEFVKIDVHGV